MSPQEIVTQKILEALEKGVIPWQKPWRYNSSYGDGLARSMSTKKPYNGMNRIILWLVGNEQGYTNPWWGTFNIVSQYGGAVREGEKCVRVIAWTPVYKDAEDDNGEKEIAFMKPYYHRIFNAEQADWENGFPFEVGTKEEEPTKTNDPIAHAEAVLVSGYLNVQGIPVKDGNGMAFYSPSQDVIGMPTLDTFISSAEYYHTLAHEIGHSTGHQKRLDREEGMKSLFGNHDYSKEELVAELTASFVCDTIGLEVDYNNAAAYIGSWLKKLNDNKKWFLEAASKAEKAMAYILNQEANLEFDTSTESS